MSQPPCACQECHPFPCRDVNELIYQRDELRERLNAALEVVRGERGRHTATSSGPAAVCVACSWDWPCPTAQAMDKVLEG